MGSDQYHSFLVSSLPGRVLLVGRVAQYMGSRVYTRMVIPAIQFPSNNPFNFLSSYFYKRKYERRKENNVKYPLFNPDRREVGNKRRCNDGNNLKDQGVFHFKLISFQLFHPCSKLRLLSTRHSQKRAVLCPIFSGIFFSFDT